MDRLTTFLGCLCVIFLFIQSSYGDVALPDEIKQEIQNHKGDVQRIIDYIRSGAGRHAAINRLALLTDTWGARETGSQALIDVIEYIHGNLTNEQGITNVAKEPVTANHWKRNEESLKMTMPWMKDMSLLSLGSSVGTNGSMTGTVIVFRSFDDMDQQEANNPGMILGKIVLYNMEWTGYGSTVVYRREGAYMAAKHGAKAALIRSVADYGIYTPHTGQQNYNLSDPDVAKIPIAAITIEDSQMFQRMYDRGVEITVELNMACETVGTIETFNIVSEITGSTKPEEVVIFGGHIDSWDIGNGVMDDGGGVMVSWQALLTLVALDLKPKRTIRAVFWSAEEIGLVGAYQYFEDHKVDNESISLIMESDSGTFKPTGVGFSGTNSARGIMKEIVSLLEPIDATGVGPTGDSPDTGMWIEVGVPGVELMTANDKYFYYHHTDGDSITMEDPDDLDLGVIVWTVVAYIVANLEQKLPRTEIYPEEEDVIEGGTVLSGNVNVIILVAVTSIFFIRRQIKLI